MAPETVSSKVATGVIPKVFMEVLIWDKSSLWDFPAMFDDTETRVSYDT